MKSITKTLPLHKTVYAVGLFVILAVYAITSVVYASYANNDANSAFDREGMMTICETQDAGTTYQPAQVSISAYLEGTLNYGADDIIPALWSYNLEGGVAYFNGINWGTNWPVSRDIWNNDCVEEKVDYCHAPSEDLKKAEKFLDRPASSWSGHIKHGGDFLITNSDEEYLCDAIVAGSACADGIDNDDDSLTDAEDPGCWTDPEDENTYDPFDNDEVYEEQDTTGTVKVFKSLAQQTEHTWSDFSFTVNDGTPVFFNGSGVGEVEIESGSYTVTEVPFEGYTATYTGDCSGELEAGETMTCYIENSVTPTEPEEPDMCVISSDETTLVDGVPSTLTWVHPNWTTELASGEAEWIWDDTQEPRNGETVTFTKTFNVDSSPTSATLKVASDNSYVATLNGNSLSCDGSGNNNFSSVDTCTAPVVSGVNTLTFVAINASSTPPTDIEKDNPAGLIYELTIEGSVCSAVPEEPTTFPITGYKWNDTDGDAEWDDNELGIENWGIVVKPMTLQPFDTVFVSATDNSVTTSEALTDGRYYLVEVSGTYKFANWSPYGIADAEWSYRSAPYTPDGIAGWVKGEGYFQSECGLDLQMNGCFDWGALNETENHLYKAVVQGDGSPLDFSIYDNQYGDNEGGLDVEIYDVTDYITYTDGDGHYSVDVEDGDYQIVEIMQDGWEQTYPNNPSYYHVTVPNDTRDDYDFGNNATRPEDQELETITICSVDGTEDEEESVPYSGLTVFVSNGEEGVTHERVTEGDDGCVSIDVDPNEGPWYVTQNLVDPWINLRVEVYGGVYYYGSELFTLQSTPFTLIPRAHAQSIAVAQQTVLGCTFSTSFTTGALCRFVNAQTQSSPSNTVSSSVGGGSCIGCGSNNGGGSNNQPQGQARGASDSRDGSSSSSNGDNKPEGEVQGEQTTIIPAGAPNAGSGGMSPTNNSAVPFMALLGMITSFAVLRMTKVNA